MGNNKFIHANEENFIEQHTTPVEINPESLQFEAELIEIPSDQSSPPNEIHTKE